MNNTKIFFRVALLLAVAVAWANVAQAQSCSVSWTGKGPDGSWYTAGNWSTNQVPGPTDDVCIFTSGAVNASGTPAVSVHSILVGGTAVLVFGSGTASIATTVTIQEGYLSLLGTTLSATSVDIQSSTLLGQNATIEGSLTNDGFLEPDQGNITVTGDYTQTSTGELSEQWDLPGTLNVNGNATLSGNLVVHFDPKKPPKAGSTFTAMTFGSLTGAFTSVSPGMAKYTKDKVEVIFP